MNLDDIKPNMTIKMTAEMKRLFQYAECEPACHCCDKAIPIGRLFKLATRPHKLADRFPDWEEDIMLCNKCTIPDLEEADKRRAKERAVYREKHNLHGYTRIRKGIRV